MKSIESLFSALPPRPEQEIFRKIRIYLMIRLVICNGQRNGTIRRLTCEDIQKAIVSEGGAVIVVSKHKTSTVSPANLACPADLHKNLMAYLQILNRLTGFNLKKDSPIFVTYPQRGKEITELTASFFVKCINRIWKEAGGRDHVTATMFRKSVVTAVRRKHPMSREVLAQHMSHRVSTADKFYDKVRGADMALPVSRLIHQTIQEPAASSLAPAVAQTQRTASILPYPSMEEYGRQTDPKEGERNLTPPREDPETLPLQRPDETEREDQETPPLNPQELTRHGRRSFLPSEAQTLLRLTRELHNNSYLTSEMVIVKLQETNEGQAYLVAIKKKLEPTYKKKLVDRVRAEIRKNKKD